MARSRRGSDLSNRALNVAWGYLRLPHPVPILIVLSATTGFALIASSGNPGRLTLIRLLLAMLGAQLLIGAVNELADEDLDRRTKPRKPMASGLVSRHGAMAVAAIGGLLLLIFSISFGARSLLLCATGAAIGVAYSLWFKRTRFAWFPYILALPLLPIWVWTALGHNVALLLLLYPLGTPAIISIYLAQSLPDIAADRIGRVRNLPVLLGERRTLLLCWSAMLSTVALIALASIRLTVHPTAIWLAISLALILTVANAALYTRHPRTGIAACFPCMAIAGAGLGLGWVLAAAAS